MRHSHTAPRATCVSLLGFALLAAYAPHASAPAATAFAPTVSVISGPSDGVACTLLTDAGLQPTLPTAAYGRINRVRGHYGVIGCSAEGAKALSLVPPRKAPVAAGPASTAVHPEGLASR